MERVRMLGNFELVYEPDMKMFRFINKETEEFGVWYNAEEAEKLKALNDDDFFATAEKSIQKAKKTDKRS